MSQVTRKMFIEEYTRQLWLRFPECREIIRTSILLKNVADTLDRKMYVHDWTLLGYCYWTIPVEAACAKLGISRRVDELRKLPKE